jgi:hypothetical protein
MDIENHQIRKWILVPIAEFSGAFEVINGFDSIGYHEQRIENLGLEESLPGQKNVALLVVGEQYHGLSRLTVDRRRHS